MDWGSIRHIAVIAPSGPPERDLLEAGVAAAEADGVKVSLMLNIFKGGCVLCEMMNHLLIG